MDLHVKYLKCILISEDEVFIFDERIEGEISSTYMWEDYADGYQKNDDYSFVYMIL